MFKLTKNHCSMIKFRSAFFLPLPHYLKSDFTLVPEKNRIDHQNLFSLISWIFPCFLIHHNNGSSAYPPCQTMHYKTGFPVFLSPKQNYCFPLVDITYSRNIRPRKFLFGGGFRLLTASNHIPKDSISTQPVFGKTA